MDRTGLATRLLEIKEHKGIIENQIKKGGNTLDTQDQLLKLYRELTSEELQIRKEWMHTQRLA